MPSRPFVSALPVAVLLVTLLVSAVPSAAQTPSPAPPAGVCAGASDESPVHVEVTQLLPRAPSRPDEPFQVTGTLTNCGGDALSGVQVRLAVGGALRSRSELRLAAEEPVVGDRRLPAQDAQRPELAPGSSSGFDVRVLVRDLQLGSHNGVFPLAVQVRARAGGAARTSVGLASTFVPWFPDGPIAPTRVAWAIPLVDTPHRGPREVMLDDELDALTADDAASRGRLQRALLAARTGARGACDELAQAPIGSTTSSGPLPCLGDPVPMTYAVDPDLLYTVEAMTRPYTVRQGGDLRDRPRSQNAAQWLVALRAAAREGQVLALPYADPDVVALSRTDSPVKDDVALLSRLGMTETKRLLGDDVRLAPLAWPPPGPVETVVDPLVASDDTALLLDESALPPPDSSLDRTPNALTTLTSTTGEVPALVADEALSRLVEPDPTAGDWQGDRLAEQRWLAETAVIAAERPGRSRTIVVAPRRRVDLRPAVAIGAIVDTGRVPWLCPVALAAAATGTERCTGARDTQPPAKAEDRGAPRQKAPEDVELSASFVREIAEVRRDSDQFTEQVLLPGSQSASNTKARLLRARGRAASSAWRQEPSGGRRLLGLLQDDVRDLRGKITLIGAPVLLTGRSGTVRMVVQNDLDQSVSVGVDLDPSSSARLASRDTEVQVVPGREARQVSIDVDARTSGRFTVQARLVDAAGRPFGRNVELQVRSTEYGRVALGITGVAGAVLLVAVGVRITRRAMRGHARSGTST